MKSRALAKKSVMAKGHSGNDTGLTWTRRGKASSAAQGVRRSSRRNDVCGCRLASALAGTGDTCSPAPGATEGATPETPVTGATGVAATLEALDDVEAAPCGAADACADCCNGNDKTTRAGTFSPSANMASREATATRKYPGASSEPTANGRAGFPSTEINAAPWPTLLAMTPERTNLSAGLGPGPASAAGVAPRSRANTTGLDMSGATIADAASALTGTPTAMYACVQYQPDTTTTAQTTAVAMRQPISFCSFDITQESSHSDASPCKSLHGIASSRPTPSRGYLATLHGFTLIELMVVLVIIGVLAALIVPNVLDRADDARVMAARTDVNNLNQALKLYKLDNQRLPSTDQGLQALIIKPTAAPVPANWKAYLDKLPNDPWGRPYQYLNPGVKGEVDVMSLGADGQPGGEGRNADIGSWQ